MASNYWLGYWNILSYQDAKIDSILTHHCSHQVKLLNYCSNPPLDHACSRALLTYRVLVVNSKKWLCQGVGFVSTNILVKQIGNSIAFVMVHIFWVQVSC